MTHFRKYRWVTSKLQWREAMAVSSLFHSCKRQSNVHVEVTKCKHTDTAFVCKILHAMIVPTAIRHSLRNLWVWISVQQAFWTYTATTVTIQWRIHNYINNWKQTQINTNVHHHSTSSPPPLVLLSNSDPNCHNYPLPSVSISSSAFQPPISNICPLLEILSSGPLTLAYSALQLMKGSKCLPLHYLILVPPE